MTHSAEPALARPEKPRWLRFGLRTLFLLTLVVAVILGVTMKRLRDRKAAVQTIEAAGGTTGYRLTGSKWFQSLIGDEQCFRDPIRVTLGPAAKPGRPLDDAILDRVGPSLRNFDHLEVLDIRGSGITDASAELLGAFGGLKHLRLSGTKITDVTIRQVSRLPHLEWLLLDDTAITDDCVDDLCQLRDLAGLEITGTQVSVDGVFRLKQRLPCCTIAN